MAIKTKAIFPEQRYKIAWTKLSELLCILHKADCPSLDSNDVLRMMNVCITTSGPDRDPHGSKDPR
jgi:hypothetical protein